jgi:replication initiation and membrane attachment protein
LQRPLSPQEFFHDGMLNVYLYQKIGRTHYMRLKNFFTDRAVEKEHYSETTRSFQDVFTSEQNINFLQHDANADSESGSGRQFVQYSSGSGLPLDEVDFDFQLLLSGLSEAMVPRKAFKVKVKETVVKLSYLYGIDPLQMKNLLMGAIDSEDEIDLELLRKAARDWYQLQSGDNLPELTARTKAVRENKASDKQLTKEEELLDYLETTSPKDVLADTSNGSTPSKSDLQAVEEVMLSQKLPIGVMNVLIQYVLLKTDMKLTKGYMEKIASHWARKKVTTAAQAMDLAKKEHQQYLEWAQGKKENKSKRKKPIRTEKLPDWFQEGGKKDETTPPSENDDYDFEAEKKKLEEELKKFRK